MTEFLEEEKKMKKEEKNGGRDLVRFSGTDSIREGLRQLIQASSDTSELG